MHLCNLSNNFFINLYEIYKSSVENAKPSLAPEATPEAKAEAERLKNEGNTLMKAEKHHEALANYTKYVFCITTKVSSINIKILFCIMVILFV